MFFVKCFTLCRGLRRPCGPGHFSDGTSAAPLRRGNLFELPAQGPGRRRPVVSATVIPAGSAAPDSIRLAVAAYPTPPGPGGALQSCGSESGESGL